VMAAPAFQRAAIVVPVIALAYLCEGLCYVGTIGIALQRRPIVRSAAVGVAALVNLALNVLLIPPYGMLGAAWATLIAFMLQTVILVTVALGYYPIPYQWGRFAQLLGSAGALYCIGMLVTPASLPLAIATKVLVVLSFPAVLWLVGFFEQAELEHVRRLRVGLRKRLATSRA